MQSNARSKKERHDVPQKEAKISLTEAFTTEITEIAKAVSLWRPLAPDQDSLARDGLAFLKKAFSS